MAKPKRPYLQLFLLTMMLVVLPVGSYLYLQFGYEHRVAALEELHDYGSASAVFTSTLDPGEPHVRVLYTAPAAATDSVALAVEGVHQAFDNDPSVQFVAFTRGSGSYTLEDPQQAVSQAFDEAVERRLLELSNLDAHCERVPLDQRAIVVDTAGTVRRCYDLHSGPEVARLVEHLTMLVPMPAAEDMILQRTTEY